jgi:hypothetical protein
VPRESVLLRGGPFDGASATVEWGSTLICEGDPVPDGMVARYRPTRERGVYLYRFREYDRIVFRALRGVPVATDAYGDPMPGAFDD